MAIKSSNKQGNPYHDESTGEFTTAQGGSGSSGQVLEVIPKITSLGKPRKFYSEYSNKEKQELFDNYNSKNGAKAQEIALNKINYDTSRNNSELRQMQREQWLEEEFQDQIKFPKKKEKKATILLGLPGSGKSTIATPLMKQNGAFIIDADNFKNKIPEFVKDSSMVSAVHQESVDLSNKFRQNLSQDGYNMIIGKVGGDYESVGYILDELYDNGYDIDVILNDVPLEVAMDRTIGRHERGETKRLVPLAALINADRNIYDTFEQVLNHKGVNGGKIYSNDVPKNSPVRLLKEFKKGA